MQKLRGSTLVVRPELSLNAAVVRVGLRLRGNADALHGCLKQVAVNAGQNPGTTTSDAKEMRV